MFRYRPKEMPRKRVRRPGNKGDEPYESEPPAQEPYGQNFSENNFVTINGEAVPVRLLPPETDNAFPSLHYLHKRPGKKRETTRQRAARDERSVEELFDEDQADVDQFIGRGYSPQLIATLEGHRPRNEYRGD